MGRWLAIVVLVAGCGATTGTPDAGSPSDAATLDAGADAAVDMVSEAGVDGPPPVDAPPADAPIIDGPAPIDAGGDAADGAPPADAPPDATCSCTATSPFCNSEGDVVRETGACSGGQCATMVEIGCGSRNGSYTCSTVNGFIRGDVVEATCNAPTAMCDAAAVSAMCNDCVTGPQGQTFCNRCAPCGSPPAAECRGGQLLSYEPAGATCQLNGTCMFRGVSAGGC
jgi:hypothetical protein